MTDDVRGTSYAPPLLALRIAKLWRGEGGSHPPSLLIERQSIGTQEMLTATDYELLIDDQRKDIRRQESNIRSAKKGTSGYNSERRMVAIRQRRKLLSKLLKLRAQLNGDDDD